jgi:signal transduction histidine kinase
MAGYIAYLASLIVFTFGALTFTVLAVSYFREQRPARGRVFPAFTLLCAVAFLSNLLARPLPQLGVLRELATGMLPAVLLHLVWPRRRPVLVFYCVCCAVTAAHLVNPDQFDWAPGVMLGIAGLIGAIVGETLWGRILPGLMFLSAAAAFAWPNPLLTLLPDYLLLAFFCVYLYYKERLVFFDLLIKRGAYFLFAVGLLTAFFSFVPRQTEPWMAALLLAPLWLIGPWLDRRLEGLIDRLWLRRKYAAPDAERLFLTAVQQAANEPDLQTRAEQALADIFQTVADVRFADAASIDLQPRANAIPFMSDDHRLLQSLTRTLSVVLDNVRFRDREQQLRLLATRAELKALRAQINPHFLFNGLNAIAGLIQDQPALADETIEQLAHVFRYTLRKSETEWVRLEEEVEFITAYLRVEQARFGHRLRVEVDIDPEAATIPVPAMTIQALIENALKHGAANVPGPATVALRGRLEAGVLAIEVCDNGPGFPPGFTLSGGGGHGLRNVAERIHGYYGDAARLEWNHDGAVTRVCLTIPRRTSAASNDRR